MMRHITIFISTSHRECIRLTEDYITNTTLELYLYNTCIILASHPTYTYIIPILYGKYK